MNYSWVKIAPVVVSSFLVITDQQSAAISVQAVDDVGYSVV